MKDPDKLWLLNTPKAPCKWCGKRGYQITMIQAGENYFHRGCHKRYFSQARFKDQQILSRGVE